MSDLPQNSQIDTESEDYPMIEDKYHVGEDIELQIGDALYKGVIIKELQRCPLFVRIQVKLPSGRVLRNVMIVDHDEKEKLLS